MKKFIIILLLATLFYSCMNNQKAYLYVDYIERFESLSSVFRADNEQKMIKLERLTNDLLYGHPMRVGPMYENAQLFGQQSHSILVCIDSIKKQITDNQDFNSAYLINLKNHKYKLHNDLLSKLKDGIVVFKDSVQGYLNTFDSNSMEMLSENIRVTIESDINRIDEITKSRRQASLVLLSYMSKIQTDILWIENEMLNFIGSSISTSDIFLCPEPIVEPIASELTVGEEFNAEIYFSVKDTTTNYEIFVEGKPIFVERGEGFYRKRIGNNVNGFVVEKGSISFIRSSYGDSVNIPFEIDYEVIK